MLPTPAAPGTPGSETGPEFGRWHSRVRGAPEVLGQVPVSCLAEEIDTPGEGQIKALITVAGNPALSAPGAARLEKALPLLDAMISVDNWINETTKHAHVILPGLSPLEQPHFDDLLWQFAVRSAGKWSDAIFPPTDGRPGEWEVLVRLAGIISGQQASEVDVAAFDDAFLRLPRLGERPGSRRRVRAQYESGGPERMLDLSLRTGPWGDRYGENPDGISLQTFKDNPDGLDFGPMTSRRCGACCVPRRARSRSRPSTSPNDIPRLLERLDRPADSLVLTSRRHLRSNNSWMHQVDTLVGGSNRCTLLMNPKDAARCGVTDRGTGQGHQRGGKRRRRTAGERRDDGGRRVTAARLGPHGAGAQEGVNRRPTPASTPTCSLRGDFVDVPSGNAVVNGFPVTVTRSEVSSTTTVAERVTAAAAPEPRAAARRRCAAVRREERPERASPGLAGRSPAVPVGDPGHQRRRLVTDRRVPGTGGAQRPRNARWRSLATTGFCGGFTTWSTFMVGSRRALHRTGGRRLPSATWPLSVVAGLVAVVTGAGPDGTDLAPRLTAGGEP